MSYRIGNYRVLRKVATGGMGTVYAALQEGPAGFSKAVAIKLLHAHLEVGEEWRRRFASEAMIGARLVHPNVVSVLGFDHDDEGDYIVMEYVDGCSLSALLRSRSTRLATAGEKDGRRRSAAVAAQSDRLVPALSAYIVREALAGIAVAHEHGIVHRDLSPKNVLISRQGEVKVSDFGIASIIGQTLTTGGLRGTIPYMSPEQANGRPVDEGSDLFSAGLILYELLTGQQAYRGRSEIQALKFAQQGIVPLQALSGVDARLETIVSRALQFERRDRFGSATEFREALDLYLERVGRPVREDLAALVVSDIPAIAELIAAESEEQGRVTKIDDAAAIELPAATELPRPAAPRLPSWAIATVAAAIALVAMVLFVVDDEEDNAPIAKDLDGAVQLVVSAGRDATPVDAPASPPDLQPVDTRTVTQLKRRLDASRRPVNKRSKRRRHHRRVRATGMLVINTLPVWSRVRVDGRPRGTTPLRIQLPVGTHRVVVQPLGRGVRRSFTVLVRKGKVSKKVIVVRRPD